MSGNNYLQQYYYEEIIDSRVFPARFGSLIKGVTPTKYSKLRKTNQSI